MGCALCTIIVVRRFWGSNVDGCCIKNIVMMMIKTSMGISLNISLVVC